jgi:hypothetical protein
MIEIAPESYWKHCSPANAMQLCNSLSINGKTGWRLPTLNEWWESDLLPYDAWILDQVEDPYLENTIQMVSPVRDLI